MNEQALEKVLATLDLLPNLRSKLEVLSNVFIIYGILEINKDSTLPEKITPENVISLVLDDIEEHGNRLGNSLAMQGITIQAWLKEK